MIKKIHLILILLGFLLSCSSCTRPIEKRTKKNLRKFKNLTLLKKIEWEKSGKISKYLQSTYIIYPASIDFYGYCGVFLFYKFDKQSFESQKAVLQKKAIDVCSAFDSCDYHITDCIYDISDSCINNFPPIPDLQDKFSPIVIEDSTLSKDSKFYILNSKEGAFLNEEYLNLERKKSVCRNITNGYSLGALVDDSNLTIAYWILIW